MKISHSEYQNWLNTLHKMRIWASENSIPIQGELTTVRRSITASIQEVNSVKASRDSASAVKERKKKPIPASQLKTAEKIINKKNLHDRKTVKKTVYRKLPSSDVERDDTREDALNHRMPGSYGSGKRN